MDRLTRKQSDPVEISKWPIMAANFQDGRRPDF
jgi:hypothetical protein